MKRILLIAGASALSLAVAAQLQAQQPPPLVTVTGNNATVACPAFPPPVPTCPAPQVMQNGLCVTPTTPPPCLAVAATWKTAPIAKQSATFRISFDLTPASAGADLVSGLSNGAPTDYTSLAVAVRLNNTNTIDARNGAAYAALSAIPYVPGKKYQFVVDVDIAGHKYSATVNGLPLAKDYAFRTEQATVAALDTFGSLASTGTANLCSWTISAAPVVIPPVVTAHSVSLNWSSALAKFNVYRSDASGSGYVKLTAAPLSVKAYTDTSVVNGKTYFYVATALDATGLESAFSLPVPAVIPAT